jgi:predicted AAA+ superfamily ATPase
LDELPPYFHAARAREVGHTDLSELTTTALANLFVAVQRPELSNTVVVLSDLDGRNYGLGHENMHRALDDLRDETGRTALQIQPVRPNNDELYHILRRRLFAKLPSPEEIDLVARAYQKALKDARDMGFLSDSPEAIAEQIRDSYPFHPSLRDLYARFKENPGFQQTRGILRLARAIVATMFAPNGNAARRHLVAPYDADLNDRDTLAQVQTIHASLTNAITQDIATAGDAVAERIDTRRGGQDARDAATHLLVASLANIPNATQGLTDLRDPLVSS